MTQMAILIIQTTSITNTAFYTNNIVFSGIITDTIVRVTQYYP